MAERYESLKFVFSVEGETEEWYLEWFQNAINSDNAANYHVKIDVNVEKNPMKLVKKLNAMTTHYVTHLCDVEGQMAGDLKGFETTLANLKEARTQKSIAYKLGYSNLSFELWMILHKRDCNSCFNCKSEYLDLINTCYAEDFISLSKYKEEASFKRCLSKLSLNDVRSAIKRAERIMLDRRNSNIKLRYYKGYSYYPENPALSIQETIKMILKECGLLNA